MFKQSKMSTYELWVNFKQPNIHVTCIPEERETQNTLREIIAKISPNYMHEENYTKSYHNQIAQYQ